MRSIFIFILLLFVLFSGCLWKVPLSKPQGIAIDSQLVGDWSPHSDSTHESFLRIMPFNREELIMVWIDCEDPDNSDFYRAYPIRIKGKDLLQVQVLHDSSYTVLQYEINDSLLQYNILNEDIVPDSINSTSQLRKVFKKEITNPKLFVTMDSLVRKE